MQLHELTSKTGRKSSKRLGRGRGSGKGKTSGRGTKGQRARAGHRIRPDVREKLKKLPKLRGYRFASFQTRPVVVNLEALEAAFGGGESITPQVLTERGLVRVRRGQQPVVKILGTGTLTKKFAVSGCAVSAAAKEKIQKAGGTVA